MIWMLVISIIFFDQLTKQVAVAFLRPIGSVSISGDLLWIAHVESYGMAPGLFLHSSSKAISNNAARENI